MTPTVDPEWYLKTYPDVAAAGKFITNHDSDDWSHPQRLERMANSSLTSEKA